MTEMQPLRPLTEGIVLIVGTKPSNFDDSIRTHPRVVMWDSQHEHWTNKNLPSNTRAVFITRFIGHAEFNNIVSEARKRRITVFNPSGTGIIARQVKELLTPVTIEKKEEEPMLKLQDIPIKQVEEKKTEEKKHHVTSKLHVLHPFIDVNKTISENVAVLLEKAKELNVQTTDASLRQMLTHLHRKGILSVKRVRAGRKPSVEVVKKEQVNKEQVKTHPFIKTEDVSILMLDDVIKGLTDLRQYMIDTIEENRTLKERVEKLKKVLG